jgi:hypothetical protein
VHIGISLVIGLSRTQETAASTPWRAGLMVLTGFMLAFG